VLLPLPGGPTSTMTRCCGGGTQAALQHSARPCIITRADVQDAQLNSTLSRRIRPPQRQDYRIIKGFCCRLLHALALCTGRGAEGEASVRQENGNVVSSCQFTSRSQKRGLPNYFSPLKNVTSIGASTNHSRKQWHFPSPAPPSPASLRRASSLTCAVAAAAAVAAAPAIACTHVYIYVRICIILRPLLFPINLHRNRHSISKLICLEVNDSYSPCYRVFAL
jgi:hypothetical protein